MQKNLLKIFKYLFCSLVIVFLLLVCYLAALFYCIYQFVLLTIGFVAVLLLIIFIRRSRHKVLRYPAIILTAGIIFYVSFIAIPEFNFWVTFNARQHIVNQYIQQGIRTENSWLGEIKYFENGNNVAIYFTHFKDPAEFGSRVFFLYKTGKIDLHGMTVKKLKNNWYFIEGTYAD